MKKIVLILFTVLVLSCCITSSAEDAFSVRNGVKFGMSIEDVSSIETQNGIDVKPNRTSIQIDNISIAGFDGGEIYYHFSDDNKLTLFKYIWREKFDDSSSKSTFSRYEDSDIYYKMNEQYTSLVETLSEKYEIIGELKGSDRYNYINLNYPDELSSMYYPFTLPNQTGIDYIGFKQFLAKSDGEYVEIVIMCHRSQEYDMFGRKERPSFIAYELEIRYRNRSEEQINRYLNKLKQKDSDL